MFLTVKPLRRNLKKKATTALPYSAPQQNTYSDYRQSDSSPEIISFLDLFKTDLIDIFKESRKSDDDRNTKLDEIIWTRFTRFWFRCSSRHYFI